jgi:beta-glucosidase
MVWGIMRRRVSLLALAGALVLGLVAGSLGPGPVASRAAAPSRPWMDRQLSADQRAGLLLAAMTADEKFALMAGQCDPRGHTGLVAGIPRLGIPDVYFNDGPAGVHEEPTGGTTYQPAGSCVTFNPGEVGPGHATAMPAPIAVAASFDPGLARSYGAVVGDEARKKGNHVIFGPDVNIMRDPRGGRTFEAYGEDPYLAARMAVGWIEGLQGQHVIANVKHFMANNEENGREVSDSRLDERTEHEIYMPAFEASVKEAGVGTVMAAYNRVNGQYMTENGPLLNGVLKHDWGFQGFVLSDYNAQHSTVGAANGGNDLELPYQQFYDPRLLRAAVASGLISMATIDDHVRRILRTIFRFGLFDNPEWWKPTAIDFTANGLVARRIEESGIVLLRNANATLPLTSRVRSIAVIGSTATQDRSGGGSSKITADHTITPLQGITARAGAVPVRYSDGSDAASAAALAATSDVAIVFAYDTEGEGQDRQCAALQCSSQDPNQDALIEQVAAANPHTIVVLTTGAPVLTPWVNQVAGIVEAWYPGEEGGAALASVLFGDVNPSGRLPVTFPVRQSDVPANQPSQWPGVGGAGGAPPPANFVPPVEIFYTEGVLVGYRWYDSQRIQPAFAFGFGLSYTTFAYRDLRVEPNADGSPGAMVSVDVTNAGGRAGADVPQLYLGLPPPSPNVIQPPKQLKGVQKTDLAPGQTKRATFPVDARALSYWDTNVHDWRIARGCYGVMIGHSSQDIALRATLAVGGATCPGAATSVPNRQPACVSRRTIRIRPLRVSRSRVARVTVYVNGQRQKRLRGHRSSVLVVLSGRPPGTFHVRVVIRTTRGRTLVLRRTYHTCVPKRPHRRGRRRTARQHAGHR